jgi:hypothetical protein
MLPLPNQCPLGSPPLLSSPVPKLAPTTGGFPPKLGPPSVRLPSRLGSLQCTGCLPQVPAQDSLPTLINSPGNIMPHHKEHLHKTPLHLLGHPLRISPLPLLLCPKRSIHHEAGSHSHEPASSTLAGHRPIPSALQQDPTPVLFSECWPVHNQCPSSSLFTSFPLCPKLPPTTVWFPRPDSQKGEACSSTQYCTTWTCSLPQDAIPLHQAFPT